EYGIDPLGIGKALGLKPLTSSVVTIQVDQSEPSAQQEQAPSFREDSVIVNIPRTSGLEYKFYLSKGDTIKYEWDTAGQDLFFDFHGEPEDDTTGYFQSYTVSTSGKMRGSLTASFSGSHGWYWKNESLVAAEVTLLTEGTYQVIGIK
ncbi:MAG: hypothetical protein ACI9HY_002955, partial [Planctomycetaceae bacterium]